jgi:hypothetical protein
VKSNAPRRIAKREDWKTIPLPADCREVSVDRTYSVEEFTRISAGVVPQMMEHKWFIFFEEPWLYLHRSWTGVCLYKVRFAPVESGMRIAEAWAPVGYSHQAPIKPDDPQQTTFDSLELLALLDRQAGRPTKELWRRYFDALSKERPKRCSTPIRVDDVLYRWKARELLPGLRIAVRTVGRSGSVLILRTHQNIEAEQVLPSQIAAAIQNACIAGWEPQRSGPPFKVEVSF